AVPDRAARRRCWSVCPVAARRPANRVGWSRVAPPAARGHPTQHTAPCPEPPVAIAHNDTAPLFAEGVASTLRLIAYLAIAVIAMTLDHRGNYLHEARRMGSVLIEPIYRLAGLPADVARATRTAVVS